LNISGKTSKSFEECILTTAIIRDEADSITRKTNRKGSTTWNVARVDTMLKNPTWMRNVENIMHRMLKIVITTKNFMIVKIVLACILGKYM
jgi:hypothetical protein